MRVVIADDEPLIREGLSAVLRDRGFDVVASVGTADDLIRAVETDPPDSVITDIRMPPGMRDEGLRAALAIQTSHPATSVVVLSQHVQQQYARELVAASAGGVGYLLKQRIGDIERFCADLRSIAAGATILDAEVVESLAAGARRRAAVEGELTARQQQIVELMAQGLSNAAIGASLFLTERSIVGHISRIYETFNLPAEDDIHRRVRAVTRYLMS